MKKIIMLFAVATLLFLVACEDRSDLTAPAAPSTGTADFTSFVTVGNSLTAGYQNGSLYESSQIYSLGKIIADQVHASFEQPIISDPGIPGRLELHSLNPLTILPNSGLGELKNATLQKPYNNLGVPGAILYDLIDTTDFAAKSAARGNPYFQIVLRNQAFGKNVVAQALNLHPSFVTLWIGNNDVLGYATSGGTRGTDATGKLPTDPAVFTALYNMVATALADPTDARKVVAANIPNVQNVPFFTTIGPKVGAALIDVMAANPKVVGLFYQSNNYSVNPVPAKPEDLIACENILLTLASSSYAGLIGRPTGKFYKDHGLDPLVFGVDTNAVFGLDPKNPWPNAFVLDANEIKLVQERTAQFNAVIQDAVSAHSKSWALVDINSFFSQMAAKGMVVDGIKFTTAYITGNTFGLDGVHPTTRGYGVIANEFINVINTKFNAAIPKVNVSSLPATIPLNQ